MLREEREKNEPLVFMLGAEKHPDRWIVKVEDTCP
jgi:hypothetical protein